MNKLTERHIWAKCISSQVNTILGQYKKNAVIEVFGSLSKAYLAKLYNIYKIDFAIFNYTIDHFLQLTKS